MIPAGPSDRHGKCFVAYFTVLANAPVKPIAQCHLLLKITKAATPFSMMLHLVELFYLFSNSLCCLRILRAFHYSTSRHRDPSQPILRPCDVQRFCMFA